MLKEALSIGIALLFGIGKYVAFFNVQPQNRLNLTYSVVKLHFNCCTHVMF